MKYLPVIFFNFFFISCLKGNTNLPDSNNTIDKRKLARAIITESALYVGSMAYLQFVWYKDHERVPFHFYNDNSGYLQMDKFGHTFGAYLESYAGYNWLKSCGVSRKQALLFGASLGIVLQAPIEVFDGLYEGWGFSWGDIIANTAGPAFIVAQELLFKEQLIKMKFSYWRSYYAKNSNGYLGSNFMESLIYDYNSHTYWASINLNKIVKINRLPEWLNLAVGYSANGMFGEFTNLSYYKGVKLPESERYRQLLISFDLDLTKIKTKSRFLNSLFQSMFFIKIPFPAIEINSLGKMKLYPVYF